jgi:hypothetical protein
MRTLFQDGLEKVLAGITSLEELLRAVGAPRTETELLPSTAQETEAPEADRRVSLRVIEEQPADEDAAAR